MRGCGPAQAGNPCDKSSIGKRMSQAIPQTQRSCPELVGALVEQRRSAGDGQVNAIVCPSARSVLAPRPLRHVSCGALIRTPSGAVYLLRTVGHVFTEERIAAASDLLVALADEIVSASDPTLGSRLAYALELPAVQVLKPALDGSAPSQWDTRKLAVALRMQQLPRTGREPDPTALAAEVDAIEAELNRALAAALGQFVAGMDADALAADPRCATDIDLYNYLARPEPERRRNRLQLAATYPLFLRAAATGDSDTAGGLIRRTVDAGLPLVDTLARQWAVSRSVLRGLRHRPAEVVGTQWESNIEGLVAIHDRLPAEFRPGEDPEAWRAFNEHVALAESVFGRRPWTSALALGWMRHAAKRGWTRSAMSEAGVELTEEAVALVDGLRQALWETLRADSAVPSVAHADEAALVSRAWHVVDRYLSTIAPRRLTELARRYRQEMAAARVELGNELSFAAGVGFWPVLPADCLSSDGSRVVVSLASPQALQQQGRVLGNCLGQASLSHYSSACSRGEAFIVAVLDAQTREPLSTAELRVKRAGTSGGREVHMVQHTAARNAAPSVQCRTALREVLARLRTDTYQQHLSDGLKAIAARRRGDPRGQLELERRAMGSAVRRTVGEGRYQELLGVLRTA